MLAGLVPLVGNYYVTWSQNPVETLAGEHTEYRNGKFRFEMVTSDPRVSGTCEVTFNGDVNADQSATIWASWVLTNDKGTWVCDRQVGAATTGYVDQFLFSQARGTGEYEGLVSYWMQHFLDNLYAVEPPSPKSALVGWIQEAE